MNNWSAFDVARVLGCDDCAPGPFSSVETDTRLLNPGCLFVALQGENFDGHDFLDAARDAGSSAAVVKVDTPDVAGLPLYRVPDTKVALGQLARLRRDRINGPVVAVTGTNGKTSTKEMIAAALSTRFTTHSTVANNNNLVGVPRTILDAPPGTQALVVEVGASEKGEVVRLRDVVAPTIGVITNVAAAHLSGFGGIEAITNEKLSLIDGLAVAVVGNVPEDLAAKCEGRASKVVRTSLDPGVGVSPERIEVGPDGCPTVHLEHCAVRLPLPGVHQVANAMLAIGVTESLELDQVAVCRALESVEVLPGRCEVVRKGQILILNDSYNANPASVEAAFATVAEMRGTKRLVLVLGSMLELGDETEALHAIAARQALDLEPALVIAIGEFVSAFESAGAAEDEKVRCFENSEDAALELGSILRGDELVLLKGSRGARVEKVLDSIDG